MGPVPDRPCPPAGRGPAPLKAGHDRGSSTGAFFAAALPLAFGSLLVSAAEDTGSLWPAIGMHWGWNLVYHWSPALLVTRDHPAENLGTWISAGAAEALVLIAWGISRGGRNGPGGDKLRPGRVVRI